LFVDEIILIPNPYSTILFNGYSTIP